ncbi:nucleoside 2-deoxyribosyltransferase [Aeromicrobium sp.]|nr:nucleoside 2-deoxyribosyltransferase [Candidatus Saccharibacteria bacterium]
MKIYFACSIRGGRNDVATYAELAKHIKSKATLLTEIFADDRLTSNGMNKPSSVIWKTDVAWIQESDAVIAEVTTPSLGVGYEIAKAEEWDKPVLALFHTYNIRKLSAMIDGSPNTKTVYYSSISEAKIAIDDFIKNLY